LRDDVGLTFEPIPIRLLLLVPVIEEVGVARGSDEQADQGGEWRGVHDPSLLAIPFLGRSLFLIFIFDEGSPDLGFQHALQGAAVLFLAIERAEIPLAPQSCDRQYHSNQLIEIECHRDETLQWRDVGGDAGQGAYGVTRLRPPAILLDAIVEYETDVGGGDSLAWGDENAHGPAAAAGECCPHVGDDVDVGREPLDYVCADAPEQ